MEKGLIVDSDPKIRIMITCCLRVIWKKGKDVENEESGEEVQCFCRFYGIYICQVNVIAGRLINPVLIKGI
jgi:hypothetical protein